MPKRPSRATYARLIGEIAIEWNHLERQMRNIGYGYLRGDAEVGSYILNSMGNVSITEFVKFLCNKLETEQIVKDHLSHLIQMFHILRENRNILEHALPEVDQYFREYKGSIYKVNKQGRLKPFVAPIPLLKATLESLEAARDYARTVLLGVCRFEFDDTERHLGGPTMREAAVHALGKVPKPPLPDRISPPPLETASTPDKRQRP
jgi:hypothetical protein